MNKLNVSIIAAAGLAVSAITSQAADISFSFDSLTSLGIKFNAGSTFGLTTDVSGNQFSIKTEYPNTTGPLIGLYGSITTGPWTIETIYNT